MLPGSSGPLPLSGGPRLLGGGRSGALLLCSGSWRALLRWAPLAGLAWVLSGLPCCRRTLLLRQWRQWPRRTPGSCFGQARSCGPLLLRGPGLPLLLWPSAGARTPLGLWGLRCRRRPLLAGLLRSRPRLPLPYRTLLCLRRGLLGGGARQTLTHRRTARLWGEARQLLALRRGALLSWGALGAWGWLLWTS